VRAHTWAPMARETSSESIGSTHQSSWPAAAISESKGLRTASAPPGAAPRRCAASARPGAAPRRCAASAPPGLAPLCGARVRAPPGAALSVGVAPRWHRLAGAAPLRRAASALLLLFPGFWWAVRDDEVADPPDARPGRRGTEVGAGANDGTPPLVEEGPATSSWYGRSCTTSS